MSDKQMKEFKNFFAAGPKVIVKITPVSKFTPGGIALTEDTVRREQDTISEGTLVGFGDTAFDEMCIKNRPELGDKVLFIKFSGKEIKHNGKYYRILNDEEIFAYERGNDNAE